MGKNGSFVALWTLVPLDIDSPSLLGEISQFFVILIWKECQYNRIVYEKLITTRQSIKQATANVYCFSNIRCNNRKNQRIKLFEWRHWSRQAIDDSMALWRIYISSSRCIIRGTFRAKTHSFRSSYQYSAFAALRQVGAEWQQLLSKLKMSTIFLSETRNNESATRESCMARSKRCI